MSSEVYFIAQVGHPGLIKIGYCKHGGEHRLKQIRTMSPVALRLLGAMPGGAMDERRLHTLFHACREHGEWFRPEEKLLLFIRDLQGPQPSPVPAGRDRLFTTQRGQTLRYPEDGAPLRVGIEDVRGPDGCIYMPPVPCVVVLGEREWCSSA